jgi:hypothetical protein
MMPSVPPPRRSAPPPPRSPAQPNRPGRASSSRPTSAAPTSTTTSRWSTCSSTPTCWRSRASSPRPTAPVAREHILTVLDRATRSDYPNLRTWSARYPAPDALRGALQTGRNRGRAVRRPPPHHGGLGVARRLRPAPRPAPVACPRLGRTRRSRPGAARRARHPPAASRPLYRRPQQEMEPRCLPHSRHAPSRALDHRVELDLPRLVHRRQPGGRSRGHRVCRCPRRWAAGALGDFFAHGIRFEAHTRTSELKMGDTPTVAWLLRGEPGLPFQPGWGGRYVRAWTRPHVVSPGSRPPLTGSSSAGSSNWCCPSVPEPRRRSRPGWRSKTSRSSATSTAQARYASASAPRTRRPTATRSAATRPPSTAAPEQSRRCCPPPTPPSAPTLRDPTGGPTTPRPPSPKVFTRAPAPSASGAKPTCGILPAASSAAGPRPSRPVNPTHSHPAAPPLRPPSPP